MEFYRSTQVEVFRLHAYYSVPETCLVKWIRKAVRLNVREFKLRVSLLNLPLSLCNCKTLTKLILHRTSRDRHAGKCWECPFSVGLPCLKTLDIDVCNDRHENAFKVISGCPILENLSLEVFCVYGEDRYQDYIFRIPTLKRLKLTLGCDLPVNKVVLNVPNLEYLFLGGEFCSPFVLEDVSSLVEATLSIEWVDSTNDNMLVEPFKGLSGVKSFSAKIVKNREGFPFILHFPIFSNMTRLELKRFWDPRVIPHILERSPQLTCLCVKLVHDLPKKLEGSNWIAPTSVPACMLTNLTTIKFKCAGQKCVIEILEYMIRNAEALKTVTITWQNLRVAEESRLGAHLLKVPRASRDCEISFIGSGSLSNAS